MTWGLGIAFAVAFAILVTPSITAERWLASFGVGPVTPGQPAPITVRVPAFTGLELDNLHVSGGGVVIARGEIATREVSGTVDAIIAGTPHGALPYLAFFVLVLVLGTIFTHHMQRSTLGRLVRVQIVSLVSVALLAATAKIMLLGTAASALVVPVAVMSMVPTMVLDRVVGLATGVLAALLIALLGPFDLGIAILMLVQASTAGLVVAERPRNRWRSALIAGAVTTLLTTATYILLVYLTTGDVLPVGDPLHSPWLAAAIGPAIATVVAVPMVPIYQLLVGEITHGKLVALEDLSHPLLKQIADRAPGTWQHSLAMANMAEIAANTIGANGRLVRVGAYFHDLGKSLQPKYFIENLEPGETSPHDKLPPEVSCDAIFAHVTEGIVAARKAGLHERIVDFMHMHHGNGVLEYFWGKTKEQGNPHNFTVEHFRYPGHPPQTRETAILAICDAVEAASRTLKKPDAKSIDSLVQRIVYGKLHLGQLDESGMSMADLRRVSDSLRETIRHANHGRIEYPWQKAEQDASASQVATPPSNDTSQLLRLDSLDRRPVRAATPIPVGTAPSASDSQPLPGMPAGDSARPAASASQSGAASASQPAASASQPAASASQPAASASQPAASASIPTASASTANTALPAASASTASASMPAAPSDSAVIDLGAAERKSSDNVARPDIDAEFEREVSRDLDAPVPAPAPAADAAPLRSPTRTLAGGAPPPSPAPPTLPANDTGARKRAATLPPTARAPRPPTVPPPGLSPALGLPAEPPRSSPPSANQTLLGQNASLASAERRRAPTVPSDPPLTRLADRAASDPSAWSTAPERRSQHTLRQRPPTRPPASDSESTPTDPPPTGAQDPLMTTLRGPSAPSHLPASPESPPHYPARPSINPDESAPTLRPATPTATPTRISGPPVEPVELDSATTNPPPLRRQQGSSPPSTKPKAGLPGILLEQEALEHDARVARESGDPASSDDVDMRVTAPRRPLASEPEDAGRTEPSLPRVDLPLRAPPPSEPPPPSQSVKWSAGLAHRIDAAIDEWGVETPVAPPTRAELQSLLGSPDPTRQQSLEELERLHAAARDLPSDPEILMPQRKHTSETHEVDADDIEASIEVAPRARTRSPSAIGVAKPKKPKP